MGLEAGSFINDLNVANPPGSDNVLQGDDHIRLMKTVIKATFPNADKAFYLPDYVTKAVDYTILVTDINKFIGVDSSAATRTMTLPALAAGNDGWCIWIFKESSANDAIISGTINGVANITLGAQYQTAFIWWTGTAWRGLVFSPFVTHLTTLTDPAVDDNIPIYDTSSSGAPKKISVGDFFKGIDDLIDEATPAVNDRIAVYDTSAATADSMRLDNLFKTIEGLTEDPGPAWTADFFPSYDTSAGAAKKVKGSVINPFGSQLLHVRDEKASGTNGGTFTSGAWRQRDLNTTKTNEISGASLAANQITLPAGTYYLEAVVTAFDVNNHQAKLRNTSDGTDVLISTTGRSGTASNNDRAFISGRFTIAAEKVFQIQHQCQTTRATEGFGFAAGFGVVEVYTDVRIWKI